MILNCSALPCLLHLLSSPKESIRKEACWTISNITAGNRAQIQVQHWVFPGSPIITLDSIIFPYLMLCGALVHSLLWHYCRLAVSIHLPNEIKKIANCTYRGWAGMSLSGCITGIIRDTAPVSPPSIRSIPLKGFSLLSFSYPFNDRCTKADEWWKRS